MVLAAKCRDSRYKRTCSDPGPSGGAPWHHRRLPSKAMKRGHFSLSPDGKSLAVLRGHYDSDVVLLQESKP